MFNENSQFLTTEHTTFSKTHFHRIAAVFEAISSIQYVKTFSVSKYVTTIQTATFLKRWQSDPNTLAQP